MMRAVRELWFIGNLGVSESPNVLEALRFVWSLRMRSTTFAFDSGLANHTFNRFSVCGTVSG